MGSSPIGSTMPNLTLPSEIVNTCKMLGIDPPRILTEVDVQKKYPNMPQVQKAIWGNIKALQTPR